MAFIPAVSLAQVNETPPDWFPFTASGFDASQTVTALSYLNTNSAGRDGSMRVQNGVCVNGAGNRLKFFGTNSGGNSLTVH